MGGSGFVLLGAAAAAMTIRWAMPAGNPTLGALWLSTVMTGSVAAMALGIRRHRPPRSRGWHVLAAGIGLYTVTTVAGMAARAAGAEVSGVALGAMVATTLVSFVLLAVGVARVLRVRDVRLDWGVGLDAAMLAVVFGYFVWELVFEPSTAVVGTAAAVVIYGNVLLASIAGAVCLRTGTLARRPGASYWLVTGAVVCGTAATILRVTGAHVGWDGSAAVSSLMGVTWILLAGSTLHRSMSVPLRARAEDGISTAHLGIAGIALMAVPFVAVQALAEPESQLTQTVLVTGVLSGLALSRVRRAVTGHQRAIAEVERSSARFRSLVQNAHDPVLIVDRQGLVVYASPAIRSVTGFGPVTYEDTRLTRHVHPDDVTLTAERLAEAVQAPDGANRFELRLQHHRGGYRWLEIVALDRSDEESVAGIVLNMRDVSDRKAAEGELSRLALYDPLTGLPNRTLLTDRLQQALARARRNKSIVAAIFLDLDQFKVVNDSLGHSAGDRLLVAVATRLRSSLRDSTTLARFGGDEFVALCEDLEREEHAVDVAERMLGAFDEAYPLGETAVHVGGTVGIAFGGGDATADGLLRDADAAMYLAKARGRGSIEIFDAEMRHNAVARLELEGALRVALERDELRLLYQPIIRLSDGCVSGAEALIRWQHPERGLLSPDKFIPLAEDTGLIVPLGDWVIEEACRQLRVWDAAMPDRGAMAVSVNLSAIQLGVRQRPTPVQGTAAGRSPRQERLVQRLRDMLEREGVAPARLNLEITESVLMDGEGASTALQELKDVGVRVAVDDFGTGYSGLSYLKRLPADMMKIDRSFLTGIAEDRADRALVETMIGLAHSFNLGVVAEGVETVEQLVVLAALGCDYAQGYLIARPMTGDELIRRYTAGEEPFAQAALGV